MGKRSRQSAGPHLAQGLPGGLRLLRLGGGLHLIHGDLLSQLLLVLGQALHIQILTEQEHTEERRRDRERERGGRKERENVKVEEWVIDRCWCKYGRDTLCLCVSMDEIPYVLCV